MIDRLTISDLASHKADKSGDTLTKERQIEELTAELRALNGKPLTAELKKKLDDRERAIEARDLIG